MVDGEEPVCGSVACRGRGGDGEEPLFAVLLLLFQPSKDQKFERQQRNTAVGDPHAADVLVTAAGACVTQKTDRFRTRIQLKRGSVMACSFVRDTLCRLEHEGNPLAGQGGGGVLLDESSSTTPTAAGPILTFPGSSSLETSKSLKHLAALPASLGGPVRSLEERRPVVDENFSATPAAATPAATPAAATARRQGTPATATTPAASTATTPAAAGTPAATATTPAAATADSARHDGDGDSASSSRNTRSSSSNARSSSNSNNARQQRRPQQRRQRQERQQQ